MRKMLTALLAAATVLSLAIPVSAEQADPAKMYMDAMKKVNNAQNLNATATIDVNMRLSDETGTITIPMAMELDIKMKNAVNNYEMSMLGDFSVLGQEGAISYYYKDGSFYMDMMGQKMKTAVDLEAMTKDASALSSTFSAKDLENLTLSKSGDDTVISYRIGRSTMQKYLDAAMGDMGELLEGGTILFNTVNGSTYIDKDGYVSQEKIKFSFSMNMGKDKIVCAMDMTVKYNGFDDVTITYPTDLNLYKNAEDLLPAA